MDILRKSLLMTVFGFFLIQAAFAEELPQEEPGRTQLGVRFNGVKAFGNAKFGSDEMTLPSNAYFAFIGPSFHADYLILNWLSLGAQYRIMFDIHSIAFHDLDGVVKFLMPSPEGKHGSNFYIAIPAGYSRMTDSSNTFAKAYGFNVGGLFGSTYFFNSFLGFSGEVGYVYRRIGLEKVKTKSQGHLNLHELAVNVGLTVRF